MQLVQCRRLLCVLLVVLFSTVGVQAQEYYRWHDSSGALHVSQTPPAASVDYEIVNPQDKSSVIQVKARPSASAQKPIDAKQIAALNQQIEQVSAQLKQQNCEQARANKQRLLAQAPVAITNADGASVALTTEMRAEQQVITEQQIIEFCQPATTDRNK